MSHRQSPGTEIYIDLTPAATTAKPQMVTVKFGSVTVTAERPSDAVVAKNIKAGQEGFLRAMKRFSEPGLELLKEKDIPYYRADPENPESLIRELNGIEERGQIMNGIFKVAQ